jgi:hypothetical protein
MTTRGSDITFGALFLAVLTVCLFVGTCSRVRAAEPPALEAWTLAALERFAPSDRSPQLPGHEETPEQARERYREIAHDIALVAEESAQAAEGKPGAMSARSRAALLVAVAIGESRLARDTDLGPCHRGKPGGTWWTRCDSGTSGSIWQIKTPVLWEGEKVAYLDVFKNRQRAARISLRASLGSLGRCRHLPAEDRLSALGGACREGLGSARARYRLWQRVRAWEPKP